MPSALSYPGVYVEEIASGVRTITGVATSVTAFIGRARKGPVDEPVDITSYADFERRFGGLWLDSSMSFAVRDFFTNGGARAVIVRVFGSAFASDGDRQAAVDAVKKVADAAASGANGKDAKDKSAAAFKTINDDAQASPATKSAAKAANDSFAALADDADATAIQAVVKQAAGAIQGETRKLDAGSLKFRAISPGQWAGYLRIQVSASQKLDPTAGDSFDLTVTDGAPGGSSETYLGLGLSGPRRVDKVLAESSSLIVWDGDDLGGVSPPTLPDFSTVKGDKVGGAYAAWLDARSKTPDPTDAAVVAAKKAFDDAQAESLKSLGDGAALDASDFLGAEADKRGLFALEKLYTSDGIFNLLCIPPYTADNNVDVGVVGAAAAYCEKRRAMLLVDPPAAWAGPDGVDKARKGFSADPDQIGTRSKNAALFFPRLNMPNPLRDGQTETFAPCGVVAGVFARTDTQRGVWKSPAGLDAGLVGVSSLSVPMTDEENGLLNPLGINCLRTFPVFGRVVWGARTLRGADAFADEYKYIAVRRTALYIEESLYRALKWVVFEPNDEPLWAQIRLNVGAFMHDMFRQGAFQGASARDAYFVRCDATTTTQNDINLGIVNVNVGFAPLKPAEFVVIQLQQIAGQIET
jgi:uncharacterized protein